MIQTTTTRTDSQRAAMDDTAVPSYLGPANVVGQSGTELLLQLEDAKQSRVTAKPALTFPYDPNVGDTLLVLGQGGTHYVVGVIAASRPQSLAFPGDTSVRAVAGKLTLASDQAIELRAPRITVRTGVLRTIANQVVEKADDMRRWVRGVLAIRAGNSRRIIDREDSTRCQNSTTLAKDTVKIDGDQLHLGH